MNETEIRRYGELMRELGLTGLEITDDKNKVRLERMGAAPKEQTYAVAGKEAGDTETSREAGGAAKDCVSVTSPIVGIFYAAPAENADPYVAAGARVVEQTTKKPLPEGFQKAEFVLRHGFIDDIVSRERQKEYLAQMLCIHSGRAV